MRKILCVHDTVASQSTASQVMGAVEEYLDTLRGSEGHCWWPGSRFSLERNDFVMGRA